MSEKDSLDGIIDVENLEDEVLLQYKEYRSKIRSYKICGCDMSWVSRWMPCLAGCMSSDCCYELMENEKDYTKALPVMFIFLIFATATLIFFFL